MLSHDPCIKLLTRSLLFDRAGFPNRDFGIDLFAFHSNFNFIRLWLFTARL
jgi:hypothetical protein